MKDKIFMLLKPLIERANNIVDLFKLSKFIYNNDEKIIGKENIEIITSSSRYKDNIIEELIQCEWKKEILDKFLKNFVKEQEIPFGLIGKPLRLILTKRLTSPSITFVMEVMGKKEVIKRLKDIW